MKMFSGSARVAGCQPGQPGVFGILPRMDLRTRPMTDFAATGSSDGIGWGLCKNIECPEIGKEAIIDP